VYTNDMRDRGRVCTSDLECGSLWRRHRGGEQGYRLVMRGTAFGRRVGVDSSSGHFLIFFLLDLRGSNVTTYQNRSAEPTKH
jgi:hypothetical protein